MLETHKRQQKVSRAINDDQVSGLEEFVCVVFGQKRLSSVNNARREFFCERMERNKEIACGSFINLESQEITAGFQV